MTKWHKLPMSKPRLRWSCKDHIGLTVRREMPLCGPFLFNVESPTESTQVGKLILSGKSMDSVPSLSRRYRWELGAFVASHRPSCTLLSPKELQPRARRIELHPPHSFIGFPRMFPPRRYDDLAHAGIHPRRAAALADNHKFRIFARREPAAFENIPHREEMRRSQRV